MLVVHTLGTEKMVVVDEVALAESEQAIEIPETIASAISTMSHSELSK